MLKDLPWLPRATQPLASLLADVDGKDLPASLAGLRAISNYGWNEAELRSIGRALRGVVKAQGGDWKAAATAGGFLPFTLLVLSSNSARHLADSMAASALRSGMILDVVNVEYEAPEGWIGANGSRLAAREFDAVLLSLDRKALGLFAAAGDAAGAHAAVSAAVARIEGLVGALQARSKTAVIVETLAGDPGDPQNSFDAWLPGSARSLRQDFNRAVSAFARERSALVFDVAAIADAIGHANWHAGRYWFVAKHPFALDCAPLYADRLARLLAAMSGRSKRVLVLDLDNTLWGGIVGDDGVGGLLIGPGNAKGEAHLAIQKMALSNRDRGIVLCVASKNTDEIAREVFRVHPEMAIREEHIALFAINWNDKASNIKAMAATLELGLDSFVFLDDNPAERKQVRDALPQVSVPEVPADPSAWLPVIEAAAYFEQIGFSAEDAARADFYRANAQRAVQAQQFADHDAFLRSLAMRMTVSPFDALGRGRIAQLISKSNQFNLTTRRYSEAEVGAMESDAGKETLQIRLEDIFGDNGMISVVICNRNPVQWEIDTWIMSCRVLGRGVERAVLNLVAARAKAAGAERLVGRYIPTAKNGIVRDHYEKLGFTNVSTTANGDSEWQLPLADYQPFDVAIEVAVSARPAVAA